MADEQLSRRSLLALLGGAGAALVGRQGEALAASLGDGGAAQASPAAAAREPGAATAEQQGSEPDAATASLPLAQPVLDAGPGQPPIVARRAWARGECPPAQAPQYGTVQMAFVHHTDNPNGYSPAEVPALLRAIYTYHRYGRGWNDIGYNFVIDRFGRTFEARAGGIDEPVVGAQAGGYNGFSTGIALLGDYEVMRTSTAAREALQHLLAWKLSLHGVPVQGELTVHCEAAGASYSRFPANAAVKLDRVSGHRQADSTTCPGDALYGQLARISRLAAQLAGRPAAVTLAVAPAPAAEDGAGGGEAGAEESSAGAVQRVLGGKLAHLDGAAIAGAPIEIQVRSVSDRGGDVQERTIAMASTDADGHFSVELAILPDPPRKRTRKPTSGKRPVPPPQPLTSLRALCRGGQGVPATISPPLTLAARLAPR